LKPVLVTFIRAKKYLISEEVSKLGPKLKGRKPEWLPKIVELLDVRPRTRDELLQILRISPGRLSEILKDKTEQKIMKKEIDAQNRTVYALSGSGAQDKLKRSICAALGSLPLYSLETIATSYVTLPEDQYAEDVYVHMGINFVLQHQFSLEMAKIVSHYNKEDQLSLLSSLGFAALNGLDYCLKKNVAGLEKKLGNQIATHPDRVFQLIRKDLFLLLEYGLKDLVPSFVKKESHLRLLAAELGNLFAERGLLEVDHSGQAKRSITLRHDDVLLRDFLGKLANTEFMLLIQFGKTELEENWRTNQEKSLRSFDLWMQRLQDGMPTEHPWFLFEYGTRNLKKFIKVLRRAMLDSKFVESKDYVKNAALRRLYLPKNSLKAKEHENGMLELEEALRFAVDLWGNWDLQFLFEKHPRGKQPEFYSEILSLVQKSRNRQGFQILPKNEKITEIRMTSRGLLIYREGQNEPDIIAPK
jgi:hypothetical protein